MKNLLTIAAIAVGGYFAWQYLQQKHPTLLPPLPGTNPDPGQEPPDDDTQPPPDDDTTPPDNDEPQMYQQHWPHKVDYLDDAYKPIIL